MLDGLEQLLRALLIFFVLAMAGCGYFGVSLYKTHFRTRVIESKTLITPDYRLKAHGKKIDTIYIYKFVR